MFDCPPQGQEGMRDMTESKLSTDDIRDENRKLAARVLDLARNEGLTIGTAESCTGGLCAATLTEVPGSSDVVRGGIVSYWVEVKEAVLGVSPDTIAGPGVVSEQCAREMAQGRGAVFRATWLSRRRALRVLAALSRESPWARSALA